MVVEVRPWNGTRRLDLKLMVVYTFFLLKIACLKSTVLTEEHPSMWKLVLQTRGFVYDSASNPLAYRAVTAARDMPMSAQALRGLPEPRNMHHRLLAVRAKNKMASVGSSRYGCTTIGISRLSQGDMPMEVARPIFHSQGSRRRVVAKSAGSREPVHGCVTLRTVALRRPVV
jgi:hypothetical protein